ncbi:MAG: hypothetical protein OQK78_05720 [Gammaproteobacteria bacterium]|nr:hypothetical protein [Gammaproteobacteria bacterium]
MKRFPTLLIAIVALMLAGPPVTLADEWSDAGFSSLRSVIWQSAGFTLREAKRWRSRCNITDPKQVAEWELIGLNTPTEVSFWMKKGYTTPEMVVDFRNSESGDGDGEPPQVEVRQEPESSRNSQISSERKKREWQRKSQISDLVNSGVAPSVAEEWIYSGYSSEESKSWLKIEGIELPDDINPWSDIGIDSPETLYQWLKIKQVKSPSDLTAWMKIGVADPATLKRWLEIKQINRPADLSAWLNIGVQDPEAVTKWLKFKQISKPDDLSAWFEIGIEKPLELQQWLSKGLTTVAAVKKQMIFEKSEDEKFARRGISPESVAAWKKIGAQTYNQVNYLLKRGFTIEELKGWVAAGFTVLNDIEIWRKTKLGAEESKRWRAAGFIPEEVFMVLAEKYTLEEILEWSNVLGPVSSSMERINSWRASRFSPADAKSWIEVHQDVSAAKAAIWRDAGYRPESEWVLLDTTPEVVERWRNSGAAPSTVMFWVQSGFGVSEALPWIEVDLSAQQSRKWRDNGYTPDEAMTWIRHGITSPTQAQKLKQITIDVSDHFSRGVIYNSFRKTAKLLDIHKLHTQIGPRNPVNGKSGGQFDTLTPYAKCMTAYANKDGVSDSTVMEIEGSYFNGIIMRDSKSKRFMGQYHESCKQWTVYIYTIWLVAK